MKYLLIEPKAKAIAPNIALMKFARYCEINNFQYQYVRGIVEPDINADIGLMSCIFSYNSKTYEKTINHYLKYVSKIQVGGVFPSLNPKWFTSRWNRNSFDFFDLQPSVIVHKGMHPDIDYLIPKYDVPIKSEDDLYPRHNIVLYASRGCVNRCGYCAVPQLEGSMKSYKSIQPILDSAIKEIPNAKGIVMYDNNFTEHEHFNNIVNELIDFGLSVDFCSGLHVDSLTREKARLLSRLKWKGQGDKSTPYIRFSFDKMEYFENIKRAYKYIIEENIHANMFLYCLFNFTDSPADFYTKIQMIQSLVDEYQKTIFLFPMKYEPYMALERHKYISPKWTPMQLKNLVKIYTYTRNFIPITKSKNVLIKWLGNSEQEFINILSKPLKPLPKINKGFFDFFY